MRFNRKSRKGLFLSTTLSRGVRLKDDNEGGGATGGGAPVDDGIEVGSGFAEAATAMASDDTRKPEQRGGGATQDIDEGDNSGGEGAGEESGESEGEEGEDGAKPKPKKNRETAAYIREVKREAREAKALAAGLAERLAVLEKGGLPNANGGGNSSDTSGAPDPTDEAKYPLGVLDDGYTADFIKWNVAQQVADALGKIQQTGNVQQENAGLLLQLKVLTDQGTALFDDFEDVVEAGMREEWPLTKTTFTEAAKVANGAAVLHALANDPEEALWLSEQSPAKQRAYIADKNAEIEGKKPKPRTVPKAGTPPTDLPRGRNSSSAIRADTDNLDDFRKIFYKR